MNSPLELKTKLNRFENDFNNNQNVGMTVTGDDSVDLQAEIDALLANNTEVIPPQQTQAQDGLEIPVQGQTLKFKNAEEVGAKIQEIAKNYQAILAENAALKAQTAATTQPKQQAETGKKPKVSNEEFSKLIAQGEDGIAQAMNYWLNQAVFDGQQPDAVKAVAALLQQNAATAADLTVLRFKDAHPELPRTSEAGQVLEQVRQRYNLPFTLDGLEASYAIARQHNLLQVETSTNNQQQSQNATPQSNAMNQHFATPPMSRQGVTTAVQPTAAQEEQLWEMPMDKLDKLFQKRFGVNRGVN